MSVARTYKLIIQAREQQSVHLQDRSIKQTQPRHNGSNTHEMSKQWVSMQAQQSADTHNHETNACDKVFSKEHGHAIAYSTLPHNISRHMPTLDNPVVGYCGHSSAAYILQHAA